MRIFYFTATMLLHYTLLRALESKPIVLILIMLVLLAIGFVIHRTAQTNSKVLQDVGWGLFYGTLTSSVIGLLFLSYVLYIFSS